MTPNCPACNHDNLSEYCGIELPSASDQHVLGGQICVPLNINKSPAPTTERTLNDKMKQTFLKLCVT
jgi:hypothetical protein